MNLTLSTCEIIACIMTGIGIGYIKDLIVMAIRKNNDT